MFIFKRLNISRLQLISFCCVLLLQLGQFASIIHDVEHPFHVENDLCASFISFSQHDVSPDTVTADIQLLVFSIEAVTGESQSAASRFSPGYHSRAPPAYS